MTTDIVTQEQTRKWGEFQLTENEVTTWQCGPLRLWYKALSDEIWIASRCEAVYSPETEPASVGVESLTWSRWVVKRNTEQLRIVPVLPDRSVVARPEYSFSLAPGAQARIYVRVPIWVRIEAGRREAEFLQEFPTVVLSNTWFGTFMEGELCYWLSTKARRRFLVEPHMPHLAICPIQITNSSDDRLLVEKLRLQVKSLSLFNVGGSLWADETRVFYRGTNDVSKIEIAGKIPKEVGSGELITRPREPVSKSVASRTFTTFLNFSGLDFLR